MTGSSLNAWLWFYDETKAYSSGDRVNRGVKTYEANAGTRWILTSSPDLSVDWDEVAVSSWWSYLSKSVVLWEDVTAWDWQWAVFFGSWNIDTENTIQDTWGSDLNIWDNVAREKQWFIFTPKVDWNIDILRSFKFNIKKTWAPTDNLEFNLYASDKTTPIAGYTQQIIAGWDLTASYVQTLIDWLDTTITDWTSYFLEFSRSWALDASNYYQIEYITSDEVANYWYSTYNWSAWTDSVNDLDFDVQYWKDCTINKVRKTDSRYLETNKCDWVVIEWGSADESKKMISQWDLTQGDVSIWSDYFIRNNNLNGYSLDSMRNKETLDLSATWQDPRWLEFNDDGSKMYVWFTSDDVIYEYALSTDYDITTAIATGNTLNTAWRDTALWWIRFNPDGTKLYVIGVTNARVHERDLSTAYDITTATHIDYLQISVDTYIRNIAFNADWTKFIIIGTGNLRIYEYNLSVAYDISTGTYSTNNLYVWTFVASIESICFSNNWEKLLITGWNELLQFDLWTAYDVTSARINTTLDVSSDTTQPSWLAFNQDWSKIFYGWNDNDTIFEYLISDNKITGSFWLYENDKLGSYRLWNWINSTNIVLMTNEEKYWYWFKDTIDAANNTTYHAKEDWFVTAYVTTSSWTNDPVSLHWYAWDDDSSVLVAPWHAHWYSNASPRVTITFPVKAWQYYRVKYTLSWNLVLGTFEAKFYPLSA